MDDDRELADLRDERMRWYDVAPATSHLVPHPRLPMGSATAGDTTHQTIGCLVLVLGVVYLGNLIDAALATGRHELAVAARVGFVGCLLGIPALVLWMRRRSGQALMPGSLAKPWLDVVDGARLGSVEPGNPAWGVALAHAGRVQQLLQRERRRWNRETPPDDDLVAEVQEAGARTWATGEAWRRRQRQGRAGVSPLDRQPPAIGPSFDEASRASDAAADAATSALGHGDYDLDFSALSRRRAAMYARRTGPTEEARDPRQVLLVDTGWGARTRLVARTALWVFVASGAVASVLLAQEEVWASVVSVLPAVASVLVALRLPLAAADPAVARMPPGVAMAWRDYLDAVAYVDSGAAPVTTVEAVRGCEQRVRALVLELSAPSPSPTEEPVLAAELHRLCGGAWTLVGQERAESRLLDELEGQAADGAG